MPELPTTAKTQILEKTSNVSLGQANGPSNTQAKLQAALWMLCNILIKVSEILNKARSESNLASIKAGFSSADETAKAGLLQLGGGVILAGTGAAQGVAGCKNATELAKAKRWREAKIKGINENTIKLKELSTEDIEKSGVTVQVEVVEDGPVLDEIEEEVFYNAEEKVQSCKQTKLEEQAEKTQMTEQANDQGKMASKEADKCIKQINKEYAAEADCIHSRERKFQGLSATGQALYYVSLGLGDRKKADAQKDTIEQQTRDGTQAQQEKTTDGVNKEIDRLKDFDAFRSNSSSLKG